MKQSTYYYCVCLKLDILYNCLTEAQVACAMQCPYLSTKDGKRICERIAEEDSNEEVSDFDVQHYCNGNPIHCYYFRTSDNQARGQSEKTLSQRLSQILTAT